MEARDSSGVEPASHFKVTDVKAALAVPPTELPAVLGELERLNTRAAVRTLAGARYASLTVRQLRSTRRAPPTL